MKRKCLLFPFSKRVSHLIEHSNNLNNYEIVSVSSFPGWINGFESFISKKNIEIVDISHIDNVLNHIDTVIVPPLLDVHYLPEVKITVERLIINEIEMLNLSGCDFKVNKNGVAHVHDTEDEIHDIKSCVIFISGMGECCEVDQVELLIRDCFTKLGIKTKVISSSWSAELFGFTKYPDFMYDESIDEITKVRRFNRFVHHLEMDDTELIIISLGEAVLNYPKSFVPSSSAYRLYLTAKAVPPDYSLFCIYAKNYSKEEIDILKERYITSTGICLDLMLMSSIMIDWIAYNDIEKRIAYLKISEKHIEKYSEAINKMAIIKIVPISCINSAMSEILAKLLSNPQYYVVI